MEPDALNGGVAQLGEHLLCKQGVDSSILFVSTNGLADWKRAGHRSISLREKLRKYALRICRYIRLAGNS